MPFQESESTTRKTRIDSKLDAAGWQLPTDGSLPLRGPYRLEEYETKNGPVDYALFHDGRPLAFVEAKKVSLGPQNVLTQAERYSRGATDSPFDFQGFRVPFLYSTNGEVIWFRDVRHELNRSRPVSCFHTPAGLVEMLERDPGSAHEWLNTNPPTHPRLRPYQIDANQAIENALANHKRQMLVAMATGTGKTFMAVNEVYRLMKSGLARRVLFLVDRRALAAQAVRAFAAFEPEPGLKFDKIYEVYSQRFFRDDADRGDQFDPKVLPARYLREPEKGQTFVYVSTIQRMAVNLFGKEAVFGDEEAFEEADADVLDIPNHAFDVIIADECHRGYTTAELSVWRKTLEHFDGIKIGLTATPAAHTKAYFKDIAYRYEYERAVREGFLVDYDVLAIKSDVRMNGVFLKPGEQVGLVDVNRGTEQLDLLEDERQYDTTDIERKVTSPDSNRKVLEEVKRYALEHEERYGRFPKTLVYAVNDLPHTSHADNLVDIARDVFGRGDDFVQKITGRVDRPLQRIREFRNRPKPGVVVSVDMLTTGVDIPDLEFIVFLRPVKSRILFEQMLGRGTRLGEKYQKSHFTVIDCFDGTLLAYFREATAITAVPPDKPSRSLKQIIEAVWQNEDRDYNVGCLIKRLQRIDKELSGEARELFAAFVPDGDLKRFAQELPKQLQGDFTDAMKLLREPSFLELLANYPRSIRTFVKAYEAEDTVSSEWLVKGLDGTEYKPEDYITAFDRFVQENPAHIEAIGILLDRPQRWTTAALKELLEKLAATNEHFTVDNLQRAHQVRYHTALADLISMVKHAADEHSPLLTAEERVDAALAHCTAGQTFTADQQKWLRRIREHLITNLSIDQEDFKLLPIFSRSGGWGRANRAFDGALETLLQRINEAVAA